VNLRCADPSLKGNARAKLHLLDQDSHGDPGGGQALVDELLRARSDGKRIRCPLCSWQPRKSDRWFCNKCSQGHWNTFDTNGVCPVCAYRWAWTACLQCHQWSLHEAWYVKDDERP
jgi:hypothetical protein